MKTCVWCGATFAPQVRESRNQFERREICSRPCAAAKGGASRAEAAERERLAKIEDAEWIAGTDSPERIAARLGYHSVEAMERSFYRWGRSDLLVRIGVAA